MDPRGALRSLDGVGMDGRVRSELGSTLEREHGLFLVTGPTGSGKTTTLYGALQSRDRAGRNIVTLEAALRAVLRQDPDVIMVGEMRDRETAADEAPPCPVCGGRVARDHPYCPHCGGEVARRCGCGTRVPSHWRFCGACGERRTN